MTNPNLTSPTYEDSSAIGGEDDVPQEGGEDGEESEGSREGEESEVPHEGGKSDGSPEGSVDEAQAGGQLVEDPSRVGVDALAGPSGVQPLVVIQQAAAVTEGDDPPELCEYEKLRERNIRERDEAMKEAMEEIEEAKQGMRDNAPGANKRGAEEEAGGSRKRKKVELVVEVREKANSVSVEEEEVRRGMKPVSCVVEEDIEGRSRKRRRIYNDRSRVQSTTDVTRGRRKAISKSDSPPTPASSTHNLRPRKQINYTEVPEPEADSFVWCSTCNKKKFNGCEEHIPYFGDNKEFGLEVEKSRVGKNAGDGVVNRGKVIPKGVLFGPYAGRFIHSATYKRMEKAKTESGNAWEVRDKFNKKTLGYIDPGVNPDPQLHWMAKINCPNKIKEQNLIAFQLAGQIYYRVKEDILNGEELLVWYGKTYAEKMGINMETVEQFSGKEDHTKEASVCGYCHAGMEGERELVEHLAMGGGHVYKCGVKQALEMVRMAESGERKFVCKVCGKGFQTHASLIVHNSVHTKQRAFVCDVDGCAKSYAGRSGLSRHKKVAHEGSFHECPECGKRFGQKCHMTIHFKTVHDVKKNFKCVICGVQFGQNSKLVRHTKTVHDKVRAFKCEHCNQSFGEAGNRKQHMDIVHSNICYPCTWQDCSHQASTKTHLKYHIRRAHTKEWSLECQLCEDQLDIWWGCILPGEMDKHRAKKHPVEWEEEQEAYRRDCPFICSFKMCLNRYKTEMEKDRHEQKLH